jgi:hypothetical protein
MQNAYIGAYIAAPYIALCKNFCRAGCIAWLLYCATHMCYMWVLSLGLGLAGWSMLCIARHIMKAVV